MNLRVIDSFRGEYHFLSNFHGSPLTLPDDRVAPTVEHAFQAYKTHTLSTEFTSILTAPSAYEAKQRGRAITVRSDWESVKLDVMRWLLTLKFAEGTLLARRLLLTDDALLVEGNTWGDQFWGTCGDVGKNWLGHLLMARRAELRATYVDDEENT